MGEGVVRRATHQSDVGVEGCGVDTAGGQALILQRDPHADRLLASFDLAQMTLAFQTEQGRHAVLRQLQFGAEGDDVHTQKFAYAEHLRKHLVRHEPSDSRSGSLHTPNMAEKPRKTRPMELYEDYRAKSGWYLAAWRDFIGLTMEDLADELGRSKGYISDLETGATRTGRPPTRFNRDLIEQVAKVVGTTGGRLIDVNPFMLSERLERLSAVVTSLDEEGQDAMLDMAERWAKRTGTEG